MHNTLLGRLAPLLGAAALLGGCPPAGVGDPCLQEQVPAGGYDRAETYVERGSAECVTRVCLVEGLDGDPSPDCQRCAVEEDVRRHVYCSCRCDDDGSIKGCECPEGFSCEPAGRSGSFCVRSDVP